MAKEEQKKKVKPKASRSFFGSTQRVSLTPKGRRSTRKGKRKGK